MSPCTYCRRRWAANGLATKSERARLSFHWTNSYAEYDHELPALRSLLNLDHHPPALLQTNSPIRTGGLGIRSAMTPALPGFLSAAVGCAASHGVNTADNPSCVGFLQGPLGNGLAWAIKCRPRKKGERSAHGTPLRATRNWMAFGAPSPNSTAPNGFE